MNILLQNQHLDTQHHLWPGARLVQRTGRTLLVRHRPHPVVGGQ